MRSWWALLGGMKRYRWVMGPQSALFKQNFNFVSTGGGGRGPHGSDITGILGPAFPGGLVRGDRAPGSSTRVRNRGRFALSPLGNRIRNNMGCLVAVGNPYTCGRSLGSSNTRWHRVLALLMKTADDRPVSPVTLVSSFGSMIGCVPYALSTGPVLACGLETDLFPPGSSDEGLFPD